MNLTFFTKKKINEFSNSGNSRLIDAARLNVEMEDLRHQFFRLLFNTIDGVNTGRLSSEFNFFDGISLEIDLSFYVQHSS